MKKNDESYNKKYSFVQELSKVLTLAKPYLVKCEFKLGEELPTEKRYIIEKAENGTAYIERDWQPDGEWVVVTCDNGYQYKINVTANSLCAIAEAVFTEMACK